MTTTVLTVALVAIVAIGVALVVELRTAQRRELAQNLLATFAPGIAAVHDEPCTLLVWYPLAETARRLFPQAFADLDRAAGGRFPFTKTQLQSAHARWTTEWLEWERAHDAEYKLKAAALEIEAVRDGTPPGSVLRARIEGVEREKLELYQQRYTEYVTVGKALAALDAEV